MKVTPTIIQDEFIGLKVKVVNSTHKGYVGIEGKIIDETKNMFVILYKGKKKMIPKSISVFHFYFPDGTIVEVDGKLLVGRPEDRIKKKIRRIW